MQDPPSSSLYSTVYALANALKHRFEVGWRRRSTASNHEGQLAKLRSQLSQAQAELVPLSRRVAELSAAEESHQAELERVSLSVALLDSEALQGGAQGALAYCDGNLGAKCSELSAFKP